jgi:hypothetical protein
VLVYKQPVKSVFKGPVLTNEWDGKPSLFRSAHTHNEEFSKAVLPLARATSMFAEIRKRIHPNKPAVLTCPACFKIKGDKELYFVDMGENLRGPMCRECLGDFVRRHPSPGGYALFLFSAKSLRFLPPPAETAARRGKTEGSPAIPLTKLI